MRFYDLFEMIYKAPVIESVVARVRLSTSTGEPVGLKFANRQQTICPWANTFTI